MTATLEGGWVVSSTPRPHFTPGKEPVSILQEAWWAPGPVWTGGKSRPHRDSIQDLPARSQSLYRLSYRAHIDHFSSFKLLFPQGLRIFHISLLITYSEIIPNSLSVGTGGVLTLFSWRYSVFLFYEAHKHHLYINQKFLLVSTLNPKTLFRRILLYLI